MSSPYERGEQSRPPDAGWTGPRDSMQWSAQERSEGPATKRAPNARSGLRTPHAWYAIMDDAWPAIRRGFEAWLAPENFDGLQCRSLGELIGKARRGPSGS
jgi:hypothetical protein